MKLRKVLALAAAAVMAVAALASRRTPPTIQRQAAHQKSTIR